MKTNTDILIELKELSPLLAGMEKVNPFTVPADYFDGFSDAVFIALKNEDSNALGNLPKQTAFDVPAGYFENLADNILQKIRSQEETNAANELRELSPLLYSIQDKNVFESPHGYFDGLAEQVLVKLQPKEAKVITFRKRNSFLKYAAAAMVTGILAFGVYKYTNKPADVIATVTPAATLEAFVEKGKNMNDIQFDQTLENLTAEDIASYLEKNADETDLAALSSNIEENSLPSQEEYLLDEKTLENYLKDIDLKKLNN